MNIVFILRKLVSEELRHSKIMFVKFQEWQYRLHSYIEKYLLVCSRCVSYQEIRSSVEFDVTSSQNSHIGLNNRIL